MNSFEKKMLAFIVVLIVAAGVSCSYTIDAFNKEVTEWCTAYAHKNKAVTMIKDGSCYVDIDGKWIRASYLED